MLPVMSATPQAAAYRALVALLPACAMVAWLCAAVQQPQEAAKIFACESAVARMMTRDPRLRFEATAAPKPAPDQAVLDRAFQFVAAGSLRSVRFLATTRGPEDGGWGRGVAAGFALVVEVSREPQAREYPPGPLREFCTSWTSVAANSAGFGSAQI